MSKSEVLKSLQNIDAPDHEWFTISASKQENKISMGSNLTPERLGTLLYMCAKTSEDFSNIIKAVALTLNEEKMNKIRNMMEQGPNK